MSDSSVLFIPGIGMPDQVFGATRWALACPSATWQRPGYRASETVAGFAAHVEQLAEAVAELRPEVIVGVSGGATLALAVALQGCEATTVIAHEPFVGRLVPELDDAFRERAAALGADPGLSEIIEFLDHIYGATHRRRFPPEWLERNAITIADEIRRIPEFQPSAAELTSIGASTGGCSVLATVGSGSDELRHAANDRLAEFGIRTRELAGAGHLLPIDQPELLVQLVEEHLVGRATSNAA